MKFRPALAHEESSDNLYLMSIWACTEMIEAWIAANKSGVKIFLGSVHCSPNRSRIREQIATFFSRPPTVRKIKAKKRELELEAAFQKIPNERETG